MAANFKPGDKVWIENHGGRVAPGTYAGVTIAVAEAFPEGWWVVYVEGIQLPDGTSYLYAHEKILRPRDDPPRQQEPKREAITDSPRYFNTDPYGYYGPVPSVEAPDLRPPPRPWIRSSTGRPPSSLGRCYRRVGEHAPGGLVLRDCSLRDHRRNKRKFSKQQIWRQAGL